MRSGDTRKRRAEGLGTPIFTLGSLARSYARPFHSSRRSGMAAVRLSFAISRSRRCSRNMSFCQGVEYHSIASWTMRRQHEDGSESFHCPRVRGPVLGRFVGAIPLAADQAHRADPAGRRARYLGAGHRTEALRAPRPARGRGKPPRLTAGLDPPQVPERGGPPAATATVAGEVAAMFSGTSSAPQIKAGRLRALAVTGSQRSALFPDLPTISEFYPGYEVTIWLGLFAAAGTPAAVLARLHAEGNKALAETETRGRLNAAGGLEAYPTTAPVFAALILGDFDKY